MQDWKVVMQVMVLGFGLEENGKMIDRMH